MNDIYEQVTNLILDELAKGVAPWRKPWVTAHPANYATRKPYRGINPLLLNLVAEKKCYSSRFWAGFQQIRALGGTVKLKLNSTYSQLPDIRTQSFLRPDFWHYVLVILGGGRTPTASKAVAAWVPRSVRTRNDWSPNSMSIACTCASSRMRSGQLTVRFFSSSRRCKSTSSRSARNEATM